MRLEQVLEFKYLGCVLDESSTYEAECRREVASGRRDAGVIRSLVNARDFQFHCTRVFYETVLVPILMYSSETMIRKEMERTKIRAVQMNNLRACWVLERWIK